MRTSEGSHLPYRGTHVACAIAEVTLTDPSGIVANTCSTLLPTTTACLSWISIFHSWFLADADTTLRPMWFLPFNPAPPEAKLSRDQRERMRPASELAGHQPSILPVFAPFTAYAVPKVSGPFYRKNASVSPPSTGMMCPVVLALSSLASHTMAFAQSLGRIGRRVSVRWA